MITTKGSLVRTKNNWIHKKSITSALVKRWGEGITGKPYSTLLFADGLTSLDDFDTEEEAIQCLEEFAEWWANDTTPINNQLEQLKRLLSIKGKVLSETVVWLKTKGLYEEWIKCLGIYKPHIVNPQEPR